MSTERESLFASRDDLRVMLSQANARAEKYEAEIERLRDALDEISRLKYSHNAWAIARTALAEVSW